MNQGYRHQHMPANLSKLSICFLTKADINAGWARMRETGSATTPYENAHAQALGSCYAANSILISLTRSQRWNDETTRVVGIKPGVIITDEHYSNYGRSPITDAFNLPPRLDESMNWLAALAKNCTKSTLGAEGSITIFNGRTLTQWMRDFEQNSRPGESVTDFILRRKNQQKGNSDV